MVESEKYLANCMYRSILNHDKNSLFEYLNRTHANPNHLIKEKGINILHLAAGIDPEDFSEEITKIILSHGADPNERSEDGMTPLHVAAVWGRLGVARLLLAAGADQLLEDEDGNTALNYAEEERHFDVLKFLNENQHKDEIVDNFTLTLDKIIINNGLIEGEYSLQEPNDAITETKEDVRKSVYVNEWLTTNYDTCRNITRDVQNTTQDKQNVTQDSENVTRDNQNLTRSIQNTTQDIKKICEEQNIIIVDSEDDEEPKKTKDNYRKSSVPNGSSIYESCISDVSENIVRNIENVNEAKTNDASNFESSGSYLSGLQSIAFSNLEDNDLYSVVHKEQENSRIKSRSYVIFQFPHSPNLSPHRNYLSKTNLRSSKRSKNSSSSNGSGESDSGLKLSDFDSGLQNSELECIDELNTAMNDCNLSEKSNEKSSSMKLVSCENSNDESREMFDAQNNCKNTVNQLNIAVNEIYDLTNETYIKDDNNILNEGINSVAGLNTRESIDCGSIPGRVSFKISNETYIKDDNNILNEGIHSVVGLNTRESIDRVSIPSCVSSKISNETLASVAQEYKYEDKQAGVALIEKRILVMPTPIVGDSYEKASASSAVSSAPSLPLTLDYDTDTLRRELTSRGLLPGPILPSTKQLYLKKLYRIKKKPILVTQLSQNNNKLKTYSIELEKTFRDADWQAILSPYSSLEQQVVRQFEVMNPSVRWREGTVKSSFTYLLLDPRITDNLPCNAGTIPDAHMWRKFIDSIFYVGKGKRSRPYSHLYQAVTVYKTGQSKCSDVKVQHILDIWNDNLGVVCLHIFQNVIPAEAYTREAAMIEVLGLRNLKNIKTGNYYGVVSTWPMKQKKNLGVYLLYRAMLIFLNEGERQLRPADIG